MLRDKNLIRAGAFFLMSACGSTDENPTQTASTVTFEIDATVSTSTPTNTIPPNDTIPKKNDPPIMGSISDKTLYLGESSIIQLHAVDPNNDPFSYFIENNDSTTLLTEINAGVNEKKYVLKTKDGNIVSEIVLNQATGKLVVSPYSEKHADNSIVPLFYSIRVKACDQLGACSTKDVKIKNTGEYHLNLNKQELDSLLKNVDVKNLNLISILAGCGAEGKNYRDYSEKELEDLLVNNPVNYKELNIIGYRNEAILSYEPAGSLKLNLSDSETDKIMAMLRSYGKISDSTATHPEEIINFINWGKCRQMDVVGINKEKWDLYKYGLKPEDILPPENVPGILEYAKGMYKIPKDLLRVMQGKTIYVSTAGGRGFTVLSDSIFAGMNQGIVLEKMTEENAIHEFAHILDYHGIRGYYDDKQNHWPHLEKQRDELFNVPFAYDPYQWKRIAGYVDNYSTYDSAENFAQHFGFYILNASEFISMYKEDEAKSDLLKRKYDFFKIELFNNREYLK